MSERIKITDLADVQDGDTVTVEIGGRQYTGPAYARGRDSLVLDWGGHALRYSDGEPGTLAAFVSATREAPTLPTKAGSVILVHEAHGEACDPPVVAMLDEYGVWRPERPISGWVWSDSRDIGRWQACDITPRGEVMSNE